MFSEGEVPSEVAAEYEKMKGVENMNNEPKLEVVGSKDEERGLDVGDFIVALGDMKDEAVMEAASKTFVQRVLAREGGDPKKVEAATRGLKLSWLQMFKEGRVSPEKFQDGVYDSVAKMLKPEEEPSAKEEERKKISEERIKGAFGKRAA